jgi:hypothetical protein
MTALILPRAAAEQWALRLDYTHFESQFHGIRVMGSWLFEGRESQPCMVLTDAAKKLRQGRIIPCVIPLSEAWRWAFHGDVGDPAHCGRVVVEWIGCGALPGSIWNHKDRMNVMDAVNRRLPDLLAMPPMPSIQQRSVGEFTIIERDTGRVVQAKEVLNNA